MQVKNMIIKSIMFLTVLVLPVLLYSEYYYNDFTAPLGSEWTNNLRYGQAGLFTNLTSLTQDSIIQVSGGKLSFRGSPLIHGTNSVNHWEYNGTWLGNGVMLTNKYMASESSPFGFAIKRTMASYGFSLTGEDRYQGENTIWLIQYEHLTDEWQKFINMFMLFDNAQTTSGRITRFGYYQGTPYILDLSTALDANNNTIDISSGYGGTESINSIYSNNQHATNYNEYILRITHDGSTIRAYINPDPDDTDSLLPNEFCLVLEKQVSWYSNMVIYINHEQRCNNTYEIMADYDFLLIKSVATSSYGSLFYIGNDKYCMEINAEIKEHDSGINYIELKLPTGCSDNFTGFEEISVNNQRLNINKLSTVWPRENEVSWSLQKQGVKCIFGKFLGTTAYTDDKLSKRENPKNYNNNLSRDNIKRRNISIKLIFKMKSTEIIGKNINVFIDGRQFDKLRYTWGAGATTGKMRVNGSFVFYTGKTAFKSY